MMLSKRYTILLIDRTTGLSRRVTVSVRAVLFTCASVVALPILIGAGAAFQSWFEIGQLRSTAATLRFENDSYRAVTGELATQVASLQGVLVDLGESALVDEAQRRAIANLPTMVRNRAMGGAPVPSPTSNAVLSAIPSPEDTFGLLRELLGTLEQRLRLVRNDAARLAPLADATPSIWPVVGWLSDGFGQRRDPFTGERAQHLGLDISADKGSPIHSAASGRVTTAGWTGEFGNLVVVEHDFGLTTRYAHMSKISVQAGQDVERGDIIGHVGSTGRSTAPHLHYEVWAYGRPINPLRLLTK